MKILQSIWADIRRGENIDLYITVVIAIGLVILNIFGVTTEKITAPVTLAWDETFHQRENRLSFRKKFWNY